MSVSPTSVPSPAIGAQLTLSLKIAEETVAGATVAALRYVSSTNALPPNKRVLYVVAENQVTLASTGHGTLAVITFEVVAIKASTLTRSHVTIVNPAGERSYPHLENGQVIDPPQRFGDVNRDGSEHPRFGARWCMDKQEREYRGCQRRSC